MQKNDFLTRIQKKHEEQMHKMRIVSIQWCADAAAMAANDVFQRKGDKIVEFLRKMAEYSSDIAHMTVEDAVGDKTLEYTKTKVDARLKDILGDKFQPWEERYRL